MVTNQAPTTGAFGVQEASHPPRSSRLYVPARTSGRSVLRCGLLLVAIKAALKVVGFRTTLTIIEAITRRTTLVGHDDWRRIDAATQAVAMAAAFYPGRALCLEQSLALYSSLRWHRICVRLRLGIHPYPFKAHSWVEYQDQPVHEDAENMKAFIPLPAITT